MMDHAMKRTVSRSIYNRTRKLIDKNKNEKKAEKTSIKIKANDIPKQK